MSRRDSKQDVKVLFDIFDTDKSGTISKQNLYQIAFDVSKPLEKSQIDSIMRNCSANRENIRFPEFYKIMTLPPADSTLTTPKIPDSIADTRKIRHATPNQPKIKRRHTRKY